jgi:hypothetical protein
MKSRDLKFKNTLRRFFLWVVLGTVSIGAPWAQADVFETLEESGLLHKDRDFAKEKVKKSGEVGERLYSLSCGSREGLIVAHFKPFGQFFVNYKAAVGTAVFEVRGDLLVLLEEYGAPSDMKDLLGTEVDWEFLSQRHLKYLGYPLFVPSSAISEAQ